MVLFNTPALSGGTGGGACYSAGGGAAASRAVILTTEATWLDRHGGSLNGSKYNTKLNSGHHND